jgi:hypothetical protein
MKPYIVMDAESQNMADEVPGGWNNIFGMGVASVVTYDSITDNYSFWSPNDLERLLQFMNNKLVVTFNGFHFDSQLLLGNDRIIEPNGITKNDKYGWYNYDVYLEIWRILMKMDKSNYTKIVEEQRKQRPPKGVYNLESIAKCTLNHTKNGHGEFAPKMFKEGRIFELLEYNLQDVRILKELIQFIYKYRYIVTGNYDIIKF